MTYKYGSINTSEQDSRVKNLDSKSCWNKVKYAFISCFKPKEEKEDLDPDTKISGIEVKKPETFNRQAHDTDNEQELQNKDSFNSCRGYLFMIFPMDDDTESSYTSDETEFPMHYSLRLDLTGQDAENYAVGVDLENPDIKSSEDYFVGSDPVGQDLDIKAFL